MYASERKRAVILVKSRSVFVTSVVLFFNLKKGMREMKEEGESM